MDNELGNEDRQMVEAFASLHPDLKEELDQLLLYKLSPDTEILFPGKEELLKVNGETPVTLTNYEEWLVLYTDNELNAVQQIEVEKFIETHPSAQKELALLQRSKLQPEPIVFAHKEVLYREEEKVRAIPVRWLRLRQSASGGDRRWRIAVAAVLLIGIGITTAVFVNKKSSGKDGFAKGNSTEKKTNTNNTVITPVQKENIPVNETVVADNVKPIFTPDVKQNNKNIVVKNNTVVVKEKLPVNMPAPVKKEEPVIVDNKKSSNNLPQPLNNPNSIKPNATNDALTDINHDKEQIKTKESFTSPPVTKQPVETSPTNNPDVMYASLEEGSKNKKNRGFFRKLARTFEKRTNMTATDDDKLLVGGLAFKLK
jgi:hypothetical protein